VKKMNDSKTNEHKGAGHRSRLRKRFLENGIESLLDYEVIELLLTLGTPRKDCKETAKEIIQRFGGLYEALNTPVTDLIQIKGVGPINVFGLKLFQEISERLAKEQIPKKMDFRSDKVIIDYLKKWIGREQKEHFVALYIDSGGHLIKEMTISVGILNSSIVHPREVFEPAISLRAANLVIAHNHPSRSVEPSSEDREVTKRLVETGNILGIEIRDHLIVSKSDYFSFKQQLLI